MGVNGLKKGKEEVTSVLLEAEKVLIETHHEPSTSGLCRIFNGLSWSFCYCLFLILFLFLLFLSPTSTVVGEKRHCGSASPAEIAPSPSFLCPRVSGLL